MLAPKLQNSKQSKRDIFSVERESDEPVVEIYNDKGGERQETVNLDFNRKRTTT